MTATNQYQRSIDLLDDGTFWDRYVAQLANTETKAHSQADPNVVTGPPDEDQNIMQLTHARGNRRTSSRRARSGRTTIFQRAAIAAAAGIAVIGGIAVLNSDREQEPIEVFTPAGPTETADEPRPVVANTPEPAVTPVPPTPTSTPPEPTATPEPQATPNPQSTTAPSTNESEANSSTNADSNSEGSAATGPATEAGGPDPDETASVPDLVDDEVGPPVIDPDSGLGRVLAEINELRNSQGLVPVRFSPALAAAAQQHAWSLIDFQDATLGTSATFNLEDVFVEGNAPLRDSAWFDATILGGTNIAAQLPAGWSDWQHHAGRGPVLEALRADAARSLSVGDFTHVGVAAASGRFADATVVVYADYSVAAPQEPSISVRTDGRCSTRVSDPNYRDRVFLEPTATISPNSQSTPMSHVALQICSGFIRDPAAPSDVDSRYSVAVRRQSDGQVMGQFTCFTWSTCEAVVDLQGSSGRFTIVLTKLGTGDFRISLGQLTASFEGVDGSAFSFTAGNNTSRSDTHPMSIFRASYWAAVGGWILESDG